MKATSNRSNYEYTNVKFTKIKCFMVKVVCNTSGSKCVDRSKYMQRYKCMSGTKIKLGT